MMDRPLSDHVKAFYEALWENKTSQLGRVGSPAGVVTRTDVARRLLKPGGRILDIGCWGGEGLDRMAAGELFRERHGVDLIDASVQQARLKGVKAEVADLNSQKLPYSDAFFDAVTCLGVIGQVFDPERVIADMCRVLRPKGQLVISVTNVAVLPNRLRLLFGFAPRTSRDPGWDGGQLHYFTLTDTRRLLEHHGLQIRGVYSTGRWLRVRQIWPSVLSRDLVIDTTRLQ
jgi:2-polyprenyl-3-methyl-5-hydroxy-6-metoxy-1,4-benzoquinol methylase